MTLSRKVIFTKEMTFNPSVLFPAIMPNEHVLYKVVGREKEGRN